MPFCRRRFSTVCRSRRTRRCSTRTFFRPPPAPDGEDPGRKADASGNRPPGGRVGAAAPSPTVAGGRGPSFPSGTWSMMSKARSAAPGTTDRPGGPPRPRAAALCYFRWCGAVAPWRVEKERGGRMGGVSMGGAIFIQRNKFTLSIRTVKSGSISHFPFSILNFVLLCCNIYSFLLCSGLLYCTVLFSALLCSFLLCGFSVLINPVHCVLSRQEIAISRQEIRNAGRTHQIPPITNS